MRKKITDIKIKLQLFVNEINPEEQNFDVALLMDSEQIARLVLNQDRFMLLAFKLGTVAVVGDDVDFSKEQIKMMWDSIVPFRRANGKNVLIDYLHFTQEFSEDENEDKPTTAEDPSE